MVLNTLTSGAKKEFMQIQSKEIKMVDVDSIIPNPKNANRHSIEQIKRLEKLITFQGFRNPLIISNRTGFLVVGHGRLEAAKNLDMKEVPVIYQDFKDEAQEYAYLISDNEIARWAELDLHLVYTELKDLEIEDIDLLGIEDFKLPDEEILEPKTDEDEVPEVENPITKRGDIWLLGKHRLMCGDSTMIDDVEKLMNGEKADLVFTSPPYNANAKTGDGDIFNDKKPKKMYEGVFVDNMDSENYVNFTKDVLEICFIFTDGFIFWNVSYNAKSRFEYIKQIQDKLEFLIEQICWKKRSTIPFKGSLMRDWEPIYIFSTSKKPLGLDSVNSNHWEISNTNSQCENHKACFPVELPERGINLIEKSKIIFEPFCGSGTTIIAAEKTNRSCLGMEIDEKYCDVIINRWQNYTGKKATLESTNQTYDELKKERL